MRHALILAAVSCLGAGAAWAQAKPPAATLADPLLGSRVQARVLQIDDLADGACARRLFTAAGEAQPARSLQQPGCPLR